jgi:hypothetical protein
VAALETLRARAQRGQYVGVLPASEAEIRAEQRFLRHLGSDHRSDASLIFRKA